MWDKSRPTRMIPRVEVWTSGDVTVEELRGEGEEPAFTAEELAKRLSEPRPQRRRAVAPARRASRRCCSRSTSATRRPCSGCSTATRSSEQFRVGTNPTHTPTSSAVLLRSLVDLETLDGIVLVLVGAAARARVRGVRRALGRRRPARARAGRLDRACRSATTTRARSGPTGSRTPSPRASGTARRAVVVDFGTSTNFDVVSAAGEFAGGVLAPGVEISMDALFARAARLPKVPFVGARARDLADDVAALQSGLVYGFAGQVDAIVDRIREELGAPDAPGGRDRRPRRADRAALADDHRRRPGADAAGPAARLGAQPALSSAAERRQAGASADAGGSGSAAAVDRDRQRVEQHLVDRGRAARPRAARAPRRRPGPPRGGAARPPRSSAASRAPA